MKFHSEAHRKNHEGALAYIAKTKQNPLSFDEATQQQERNSSTPKIDWEKEVEIQKYNAQDHSPISS